MVELAIARMEGAVAEAELARCRAVAEQAFLWCRAPVTGDKILGRLRACPALEQELELSLQPYRVGRLRAWTHAERCSDVRSDVLRLARQLAQVSPSGHQLDYLTLLRRWLKRFRHADPESEAPSPGVDPNRVLFPLPADVARNPGVLRQWVEAWQPFDCDVPPKGSWEALGAREDVAKERKAAAAEEEEDVDRRFRASLRPWDGDTAFCTDVDGDVAWQVLPDDVIHDDVPTPEQEQTLVRRKGRGDFGKPEAMRARRERLRDYFKKKHRMSDERLESFSKWAECMENGMQQLQELCG